MSKLEMVPWQHSGDQWLLCLNFEGFNFGSQFYDTTR